MNSPNERLHKAERLLAQLPKTHRGLIGEFGRLARDVGAEAPTHGRAFNRAEDLRLLADYGASVGDLDETAAAVRADAERFVTYCRSRIGATRA